MTPEQLREDFKPCEIETTESLISCMDGPATAMKFRRIIMLLLQGHYASSDNYGEAYAHLRCYQWANDKTSTLHVGVVGIPDDSKPDNYPGIYVGVRSIDYTKESIGDFAGMSADTSNTFLARAANLTLDVMHVAKEINDAYDLAEMSAVVLTALGQPFAMKSGARYFEVTGISALRKETLAPDRHYTVAMTVKISYTMSVSRSVESHRIRKIAMDITSGG